MEKINIYILDMVVEKYMKKLKEIKIKTLVKLYKKIGGKYKEIKKEIVRRRSSYMDYEIYTNMKYTN